MLSPLWNHIPILLSESHHHLTPSNVTLKLTTLPHHNTLTSRHLATTSHRWFNFNIQSPVAVVCFSYLGPVRLFCVSGVFSPVISGCQSNAGDCLERLVSGKTSYVWLSTGTRSPPYCVSVLTMWRRKTLSKALNVDSHQDKFKLLLQLEEIQMEVDIRKYDLFSIHLGQYNANQRLLTLEVVQLI